MARKNIGQVSLRTCLKKIWKKLAKNRDSGSNVVKDLRFEDKNTDKDLWSEDKDKELKSEDKDL